MQAWPCTLGTLAGAAALALGAGASGDARAAGDPRASAARPADVAIEWNRELLAIAYAEDHFLTMKGVRAASMMHLAMHDALNAIDPVYEPYLMNEVEEGADPVAAAAQAARDVAVSQYGDRIAAFDSLLHRWLATVPPGPARAKGIALGRAAAAGILRARDGDGWNVDAEYRFHPPGPGVYAEFQEHSGTPPGFVFGAGWGKARPFLLQHPAQFRSPPPPAIGSDAYTHAFNEVKEVGRDVSPTRTPDETHLALWWKDFCENSMNRLARQIVAAESMNLRDATRLFAFVNASIHDGYVSVFENKFVHNHWRPYTAIRRAAQDGNPNTVPDPDWDNTHHHTYPFPSYPSAHGTVAAAALTIFANIFGDDYPFTLSTPEVNAGGPMSPMMGMDPETRSFPSFSAAAREAALSRVYLGIHFRYDSEEGNRLGTRIAEYAWGHHLRRR